MNGFKSAMRPRKGPLGMVFAFGVAFFNASPAASQASEFALDDKITVEFSGEGVRGGRTLTYRYDGGESQLFAPCGADALYFGAKELPVTGQHREVYGIGRGEELYQIVGRADSRLAGRNGAAFRTWLRNVCDSPATLGAEQPRIMLMLDDKRFGELMPETLSDSDADEIITIGMTFYSYRTNPELPPGSFIIDEASPRSSGYEVNCGTGEMRELAENAAAAAADLPSNAWRPAASPNLNYIYDLVCDFAAGSRDQ